MSSLPANLQSALDAYREQVLNSNVATLSYLISNLETTAFKANRSDAETQAAILRTLTEGTPPNCYYLRFDLPTTTSISRARDLLKVEHRPLLADHFWLDGVSRGDIDVDKRHNWLALIRDALADLREQSGRSEGQWPDALPSELQRLVINVDGIMPPGLIQDPCIPDFYRSDIEMESESNSRDRVFIPNGHDELFLIYETWDVAVAVRLANADQPATTLALFCKCNYDETRSHCAWRYVIVDEEWSSEVFDDIASFLTWFATYGVQLEEEAQRERPSIDWDEPPRLQDLMIGGSIDGKSSEASWHKARMRARLVTIASRLMWLANESCSSQRHLWKPRDVVDSVLCGLGGACILQNFPCLKSGRRDVARLNVYTFTLCRNMSSTLCS